MLSMFENASLVDTNLSKWDVSNVYDMAQMLANATSFQGSKLENWNIQQVNSTRLIFQPSLIFIQLGCIKYN
jgi:surface protein